MDFSSKSNIDNLLPKTKWLIHYHHRPKWWAYIFIVCLLSLLLTFQYTDTNVLNTLKSSNYINQQDIPVSKFRLPKHKFAYATFLAQPEEDSPNDEDDKYFIATRMMAYQFLYDPETRTNTSIPFLVLVTEDVRESKRERLAADGATVVTINKMSFDWVHASRLRWRDMFCKLYLFDMTQYERILYLDSDILVVKRMDGIFEDPAAQVQETRNDSSMVPAGEENQPSTYVFAGVSGQGGYDHPFPGHTGNSVNGGCVLLRPDRKLYDHYVTVSSIEGRFDAHYAEQSLWNYIHRRAGNMPWSQLNPTWNVNWPNMNDYNKGVASLHAKWWHTGPEKGLEAVAMKSKWKMEANAEARDQIRNAWLKM